MVGGGGGGGGAGKRLAKKLKMKRKTMISNVKSTGTRNINMKMKRTAISSAPGGIVDENNSKDNEGSSSSIIFIIVKFINHYTKIYTIILI